MHLPDSSWFSFIEKGKMEECDLIDEYRSSEEDEDEEDTEKYYENEESILRSDEETEENEESVNVRSEEEIEENEGSVIVRSEEEIEENEESVIVKSEEEIEENGKEKTVSKKRKRERDKKDFHNKRRKKESHEKEKISSCCPITDVEMMFDGFEDCKDEKNAVWSFHQILTEDPDDDVKNDIGSLEILSRMDMKNEKDQDIVTKILNSNILPAETRSHLYHLEGKPYSKLYDSKARKAAAVYRLEMHYTCVKLDFKSLMIIFNDIMFVPVVSSLMKKDYNDNFLSVMKNGKAIMSAFDRLNRCFGSCYGNPKNFNFLHRPVIELSQGTVRKSMHNMRTKLTDPIEKSLEMSENRQNYPALDEMSPEQCKGKMDHVMGRVELILKHMFGSLFKLRKPGKKDDISNPYVFVRNNRLASVCERFDYGLKDYF